MKWYQSKTFWFNFITGALAIASELSQILSISQHPKLYISIITVGNIILRLFFTSKPIVA